MSTCQVTFLTRGDVFSSKKIDFIFKEEGRCPVNDYAVARGCFASRVLTELYGNWLLQNNDYTSVSYIDRFGDISWMLPHKKSGGIRPVLRGEIVSSFLNQDKVEYGEFPQKSVSTAMGQILDERKDRLSLTGKEYVIDYIYDKDSNSYQKKTVLEYSYLGKKYVQIPYNNSYSIPLSNDNTYHMNDKVWFEVTPIQWLVDKENQQLISKYVLSSGIPVHYDKSFMENFEDTIMYHYLNQEFIQEMLPSKVVEISYDEKAEYQERVQKMNQKKNRYQFQFQTVDEDEILKGAILSDIPVFLHGPSGEGKSSRVKALDPDCTIIHMENATLDSFVGKSVYHQESGKLMDVAPTWYLTIKEKCEKEPEKIHILFFEEFTNATPSVQGRVNNVILDRVVDGKWVLPDNVRIVGAGNEVEDSLAANPMTETVFNRFAHVYIKNNLKEWLIWARDNHIHPMICSYIAYRRGEVLRSHYDGVHPNADPRKWEMASRMLYQTKCPEMIRSLVGEEICQDFIHFCQERVITLEDVLCGEYTREEVESLNVSERYATVMAMLDVDILHFEVVRSFVQLLGTELTTVFDSLWVGNDQARLEKLASIKFLEEDHSYVKVKGRVL